MARAPALRGLEGSLIPDCSRYIMNKHEKHVFKTKGYTDEHVASRASSNSATLAQVRARHDADFCGHGPSFSTASAAIKTWEKISWGYPTMNASYIFRLRCYIFYNFFTFTIDLKTAFSLVINVIMRPLSSPFRSSNVQSQTTEGTLGHDGGYGLWLTQERKEKLNWPSPPFLRYVNVRGTIPLSVIFCHNSFQGNQRRKVWSVVLFPRMSTYKQGVNWTQHRSPCWHDLGWIYDTTCPAPTRSLFNQTKVIPYTYLVSCIFTLTRDIWCGQQANR